MELDTLKHFVNKDVEMLVAGVWLEGHLMPIVKGIITLMPFTDQAAFYGPCALKHDVVQAIRLVRQRQASVPVTETPPNQQVRSSLESVTPGMRFVSK